MAKKIESEKEKTEQAEWLELCDYVFTNIMGYKKGMKFPKFMALRLRGLRNGQFMGNNLLNQLADYNYKIILYTFKAHRLSILSVFSKLSFKDEQHKFNTAMKIIENNINDVILRINKTQETNAKLDNIIINELQLEGEKIEVVKESTKPNKIAEKFKDLW